MSAIDLSLIDLFQNVFGVPSSAFDPSIAPVYGNVATIPATKTSGRTTMGANGAPYYGTANGKEIYMPVTVTYPNSAGAQKSYQLPYCVVGIQGQKLIIDTPMTDIRGTVSELIQVENYRISIKGFVIGSGNQYPETDVTTLRNIFEAGMPINISSVITDIFLLRPDRSGSDQVTVRRFDMPMVQGKKAVRGYSVELESDEPFSLILV